MAKPVSRSGTKKWCPVTLTEEQHRRLDDITDKILQEQGVGCNPRIPDKIDVRRVSSGRGKQLRSDLTRKPIPDYASCIRLYVMRDVPKVVGTFRNMTEFKRFLELGSHEMVDTVRCGEAFKKEREKKKAMIANLPRNPDGSYRLTVRSARLLGILEFIPDAQKRKSRRSR